jgi:hypothetical protein
MILEAMTVLEQQHAVFIDCRDFDRGARRSLAAREGDKQRIVEQRIGFDITASERQCEQHAIELTAVERFARGLARFLAQMEFETGPLAPQPGKHSR